MIHRIHDCIAMGSEGINLLQIKRKKLQMAIKVDIRKDMVPMNWDFLLKVIQAFGFNDTFIGWINFILHSARLLILINGYPVGYFACSQGVRQGDPLSPLLFCLAEEVLSYMLLQNFQNGHMVPIDLGRTEVFPSHLLFADDVLIFCKASLANAKSILVILKSYADLSNQYRNPTKSRIYFGPHAQVLLRRRIINVLNISEETLPLLYLGVPLFAGTPTRQLLQPIADKIMGKLTRSGTPCQWLVEFVLSNR